MKRYIKLIVGILLFSILLSGCKKEDKDAKALNDYCLDTAIHFCYDICGYQAKLHDYYLVESSQNVPEEFPRDYYVLEDKNPILWFTIIYSKEPLYGGYVYEYKDGQIAYSRCAIDVPDDIEYNDETKICINDYLITDENTSLDIARIDDLKPLSNDEVKKLIDFNYFEVSQEEVEISGPIFNYFAQLENYPSYINRKDIKVMALQDSIIRYLVLKDKQCIGLIEYDGYYDHQISKQVKTNEVDIDCKFMISTSAGTYTYYLTGDESKDNKQLAKYNRTANAFNLAYNQLKDIN